MEWKRAPNVSCTDLCKYMDKNMHKLKNPGEFPEVENKIYNYLWLLIKALAITKRMFKNFNDYDPYAFYGARRCFFAFRNNLINEGKTIKGKLIRPVTSSLNYVKLLLYPMKVEYQNQSYKETISEEFVSKKFDAFKFRDQLEENAKYNQGVVDKFYTNITESFSKCDRLIESVAQTSFFKKDSLEYKHLKTTLLLNCLNILRTKEKLIIDSPTIIMWKLPKTLSQYVEVLLKKLFAQIKTEILDCYSEADIDPDTLNALISNPNGEVIVINE